MSNLLAIPLFDVRTQSVFILVLWGAGLPVIMNPSQSLAVTGDTVKNANLYVPFLGEARIVSPKLGV